MKQILVFRRGLLGDNLVAAPALWLLRQAYPQAHIALVSEQPPDGGPTWGELVFGNSGLVDEIIGFGGYNSQSMLVKCKSLLFLLCQIETRHWDLGIALDCKEKVKREPLVLRLARAREIIVPKEEHSVRNASGRHEARHVSEILLSVLSNSRILIPGKCAARMDIGITPEEEAEADDIWDNLGAGEQPKPWIAVGPWSNMPTKQWPMERFLGVLRRIHEITAGTPFLFGGNRDHEDGLGVVRQLGFGVSFAGVAAVRHAVAIMRHCAFFLGCDTGTMHMAVSAGLKCVAIFSARDIPGLWYPYGEGHIVLRKSVPCEGCMARICSKPNIRCVHMVGAEEVVGACISMLSRVQSASPDVPD